VRYLAAASSGQKIKLLFVLCQHLYLMSGIGNFYKASVRNIVTMRFTVTEADLLRRLTIGFNELNFNISEQNK